MENCIHVGAKVDKESVDNFAEAIERIFKSGFDNRMDQKTVIKAISSMTATFETKQVTIQYATFTGEDRRVIVNNDEKKDEPDNVVA